MTPRKNTASEETDEIKGALEFLTEEVAAFKMQQNSTLSLVEEVKAPGIQNKRIEHLESCVVELEALFNSRLNKVIITGLRVKPQSYARAVTADDGETNVEMQVLNSKRFHFYGRRGLTWMTGASRFVTHSQGEMPVANKASSSDLSTEPIKMHG